MALFDKFYITRRLKPLEEALLDMSEEISAIKANLAKVNAKLAVEKRKTLASDDAEKVALRKLARDVFGGNIVAVQDPEQAEEVHSGK